MERCLLDRAKAVAKKMGLEPNQVTCGQANICGSRAAGSCPLSRIDAFAARQDVRVTRTRVRRAS